MEKLKSSEIIFAISKEDLQNEALEKLGRELSEEEVQIAKKGLQSGLLTGINSIYTTIFYEMIENERN